MPGGPSLASVRCMLCILRTWASDAQARAIPYILKIAVWPPTGSSFSGSFFAVVVEVGVSEQAVSIAKRALARRIEEVLIYTLRAILAAGLGPEGFDLTFATRFWWDNQGRYGGGMASKVWVRAITIVAGSGLLIGSAMGQSKGTPTTPTGTGTGTGTTGTGTTGTTRPTTTTTTP